MALTQIAPVRKTKTTGGKKGGGGLGQAILGAVGGVAGGIAGAASGGVPGAVTGAMAGTSGGGALGQMIGNRIDPAKAGTEQATFSQTVPLSAVDEARRGQQLLEGLQIANNSQSLQSYAEPLTQAFVQSRANLHKMG